MISNEMAAYILLSCAIFGGLGIVTIVVSAFAKKDATFYLGLVMFVISMVAVICLVVIMQNQQKKAEKAAVETTELETTELETTLEEAIVDGWSGDVSDGAQMVLRQIAEDMAKKIAQNPSTVKMSLFSAGYAKNGHLYAVQQEFSCSNLMGVSETHIVKVVCESNADESKIQPFEVWLDGNLVYSQERKYAE